jgi:hypothetical protein
LNYIFSNAGKTQVFIEDVGITEVFYKREGDNKTIDNTKVCVNPILYTPEYLSFLSKDVKTKPTHFREGWYGTFYDPSTVYIANSPSTFSSTNINSGEQRAISTVYKMNPIDWDKFDNVLLCPVVRFFNSYGRPTTAICNGFEIDKSPDNKDGTRAIIFGPERLLPISQSHCRIDTF